MSSIQSSLRTHLHAALSAALLLSLCQIVSETVLIALYTRGYILSPQLFFGAQMYDFCVKLFLMLPGTVDWFRGAAVDGFLGVGIGPKLAGGASMILPNLVIGGVLGAAVGTVRWRLGRRAAVLPALAALVAIAVVVHFVSWALAIYIPKGWNLRVLVRHAGRVFVWEGAWISFVSLAVAAAAAAGLGRLGPPARWAASGAIAAALGVGLASLTPSNAVSGVSIAPAPPLPRAKQAENLIFISIDSLRADRLSCYGNPKPTSPTIDRLAREGMRYSNASSTSSWTLPAHMSMFTGRDVLGHGVISESDSLSPAIPTLAGTLQAEGIATVGIVSTPVLNRRFGFDQGFDLYDDFTIPAATAFDSLRDEPAPVVEKFATDWLRQHSSQRFLLFLHFWDVHYDYIPPPPYDTMFDPDYEGTITGHNFYKDENINKKLPQRDIDHLLALYDGEIRWVDEHLERLVALLDELGLTDNTVLVITSDHGDEFFEHGFKGHGRTLYNEVTRIPLVMRGPGVPVGQVVDTPVSLADIMPTALGLLGVAAPAGLHGVDLLDEESAGELARRQGVHSWVCNLKYRTNCQALQTSAEGALIHRFQPLRVEFYGPEDEFQQRDLSEGDAWPRAQQMSLLESRLNSTWRAYRELGEVRGAGELDAATRDRLRDLGYVD